jgi:hypothetical protein
MKLAMGVASRRAKTADALDLGVRQQRKHLMASGRDLTG